MPGRTGLSIGIATDGLMCSEVADDRKPAPIRPFIESGSDDSRENVQTIVRQINSM